mmetsp:Transcript_108035/g.344994  ORF Transcript_108035/g.344994 Transcript_108035/m.344994 type:complete len:398 (-) Transcript_108035:666-1859(-)
MRRPLLLELLKPSLLHIPAVPPQHVQQLRGERIQHPLPERRRQRGPRAARGHVRREGQLPEGPEADGERGPLQLVVDAQGLAQRAADPLSNRNVQYLLPRTHRRQQPRAGAEQQGREAPTLGRVVEAPEPLLESVQAPIPSRGARKASAALGVQQLHDGRRRHRIKGLVRRQVPRVEGPRQRGAAAPGCLDREVLRGRPRRRRGDQLERALRQFRAKHQGGQRIEHRCASERRQQVVQQVKSDRRREQFAWAFRPCPLARRRPLEHHRAQQHRHHGESQELLLHDLTEPRDVAREHIVDVHQNVVLDVQSAAEISLHAGTERLIDHVPELAEQAADVGEEAGGLGEHELEEWLRPDVLVSELQEDFQGRRLNVGPNLRHRVVVESHGLREDRERGVA